MERHGTASSRKHGVEQGDEDELSVDQVGYDHQVVDNTAVGASSQLIVY